MWSGCSTAHHGRKPDGGLRKDASASGRAEPAAINAMARPCRIGKSDTRQACRLSRDPAAQLSTIPPQAFSDRLIERILSKLMLFRQSKTNGLKRAPRSGTISKRTRRRRAARAVFDPEPERLPRTKAWRRQSRIMRRHKTVYRYGATSIPVPSYRRRRASLSKASCGQTVEMPTAPGLGTPVEPRVLIKTPRSSGSTRRRPGGKRIGRRSWRSAIEVSQRRCLAAGRRPT